MKQIITKCLLTFESGSDETATTSDRTFCNILRVSLNVYRNKGVGVCGTPPAPFDDYVFGGVRLFLVSRPMAELAVGLKRPLLARFARAPCQMSDLGVLDVPPSL